MKLCTVVHRVSLLLVVCDQSPTLWGTTFGQFELLSAHRADELAPNRDQVKFSLYLGVIHKLRWQDEVCRLGLTPWNQSCFEFKFDDTRLSTSQYAKAWSE